MIRTLRPALLFTVWLLAMSRLAPGDPPRGAGEPRDSWAYRNLARPGVPAVSDNRWVRDPIDAFILAKLEDRGLKPAPPASRVALIRRAYYDLIGLPPTPAEVEEFVADPSPDAFQRVVDRLLASPHYGEKWGRHWLDLVRYAETNGYERDGTKPHAWRYRDYVIRAFNADKPYDQFVREQLAGDEIEPRTADSIIATGFYRLGLWDDEPVDALQARYDELDDIVATTGQVFLGITINCARCHDHKADPIAQQDYYRLLAFFQDVGRYGERQMSEKHVLTDITDLTRTADDSLQLAALSERKEQLAGQIAAIEQVGIAKMSAEDQRATEGPERARVLKEKLCQHLTDEQNKQYDELKKQLAEADKQWNQSRDWALSINNCDVHPPETHVLVRGSAHLPGDKVEPGFPRALGSRDLTLASPKPGARSAGRRRVLAEWIVSRDNPRAARVMANRLWQHHFGRGIVRTANDFGKLGERPTHTDLLDWLAAEFMGHGWSIKAMHKLIMLSSTYQMSSRDDADGLRLDPANDLFWRFDMRRLTAEEMRDSMLAVNGSLNRQFGGPSIYTDVPAAVLQTASQPDRAWGRSPPEQRARRSVYIFVKRSLTEPVLGTFDVADTDSSCPVRFATTVPTQSLTSLNSDFFNQQAKIFAERLRREAGPDAAEQVRLGLRLTLLRPPSNSEVRRCGVLLEELEHKDGLSPDQAMNDVCLMLLNINEFVYLD